jgi:hypothetical protein
MVGFCLIGRQPQSLRQEERNLPFTDKKEAITPEPVIGPRLARTRWVNPLRVTKARFDVIARSEAPKQSSLLCRAMDCFASLAMTTTELSLDVEI